MTNDPNSYDADNYAYRLLIKNLLAENESLKTELGNILTSHGWKALEKARKVSPIRFRKKIAPEIEIPFNPALRSEYNSHYEEDIDYSQMGYTPEVKALAFYLPQFHTFKENDNWWGKGFTEWTNTKKSIPRFEGHYQPREPHSDIGYYTLDNAETIKNQVQLAKRHGIYGFCFYYYWFSGKRLMEKPIDIFLKDKSIDFPFCLCWANENWTRTWDGLNKNVLIEQKYSNTDPEKFIQDLKKYIDDKRYIRIDGKPIILVYAPQSIPDYEDTVRRWRDEARKIGIGEILIWSKSSVFSNITDEFIDAEFDFAPTGCAFNNSVIEKNNRRTIFDYSKLVTDYRDRKIYYNHFPVKPFFYSCTMGWDNAARRKEGYTVLSNYSPEKFYEWLRLIIEETKRRFNPEQRFIFVNAWNEWAEGTYLEPDKKFGYTNINTLSKAIYNLPFNQSNSIVLDKKTPKFKGNHKVAIQIHAFYIDVLKELLQNLKEMPIEFDLYISTNTENKKQYITKLLKQYKSLKTNLVKIEVVENIGRDVYPFLKQMGPVYKKYDIIGHFHTKRTLTQFYGELWRHHLFSNLLDSKNNISRILGLFENTDAGIVSPTCFYGVYGGLYVGRNAKAINALLKKLHYKPIEEDSYLSFPVGTMFWAKTDAIRQIFELGLTNKDFPKEENQVDATTAHALERLFGIIPEKNGYSLALVINRTTRC